MKVLMIVDLDNEISGEAVYVSQICKTLIEAGVRVKIIVQTSQYKNLQILNDLRDVEVFPYYFYPRWRWLMAESLIDFDLLKKIRYSIKKFKPDIIHLHNVRSIKSILLASLGVPMVQTIHDLTMVNQWFELPNYEFNQQMTFWQKIFWALNNKKISLPRVLINYWLLNHHRVKKVFINYFICPSHSTFKVAVKFGLSQAVFLPHFIFDDPVFKQNESKNLLFVGRLVQAKGLEYLIEAFKLAHEINPDLSLTIIGDGDQKNIINESINSYQLGDNVTLVGWVNPNQLEDYYRQAMAVVVTSVVAEAGPLVILEAFSHGRPVIAFDVGGCNEIIDDSVNGILVEPFDVNGLAVAINDLVRHPNRALALGLAGREKVTRHYKMENHRLALLKIYRQSIAKKARG